MKVGMIAAVSPDWVIGRGNDVPWHHSADLKRFKAKTLGHAVVMGRNTFESVGSRPLPGRTNYLVSRRDGFENIHREATLAGVIEHAREVGEHAWLWIVGGARMYTAGFEVADFVDITYVPDHVPTTGSVLFPKIPTSTFKPGEIVPLPDAPELWNQNFTRR